MAVEQVHGFERIEGAFFLAAESNVEDFETGFGVAVSRRRKHAGIGERILHDSDAFGLKRYHVFGEFFGEDDGEVGLTEEFFGDAAFEIGGVFFHPGAEADGVPMENELGKKSTAQRHNHPVAIECTAFGRRRNVVECHRAVFPARVENLETDPQQREEFPEPPAPDVGVVFGELEVDVVQLKALAGAAEFFEQEPDHRALAVVGWWSLGEYEQFHCRAG